MEIGQIRRVDGNIWYYIKVENVIVHEIKNNQPLTIEHLHLWASPAFGPNPYKPADGARIRNLGYSTGGKLDLCNYRSFNLLLVAVNEKQNKNL